jgi:hypothetical protein
MDTLNITTIDAAKESIKIYYKNPKDFCISERKTNFKKLLVTFSDFTDIEIVLTPRQLAHLHRSSFHKFIKMYKDLGFVKLKMGNPILLLFFSKKTKLGNKEKFPVWFARKRHEFRKFKGINETSPLTPSEKKNFENWLLKPQNK